MTASSPGLMMALIAEIIASVAPQVTVTFFSGSAWMPLYFATFRHRASRSGLAPHVIAYWLMSDVMARHAASLIASGAAKSGYPCERLMAPCLAASRVISRMTLSVNCFAFSATNDRGMRAEITGNRRNRITKMECGLVLRSLPGGPPPLINGGGASEGPSALPRLRLRRAEEDERNSRDWYPIYREIR